MLNAHKFLFSTNGGRDCWWTWRRDGQAWVFYGACIGYLATHGGDSRTVRLHGHYRPATGSVTDRVLFAARLRGEFVVSLPAAEFWVGDEGQPAYGDEWMRRGTELREG